MLPIVLLAALAHTVTSQTWTSCNPLHGTCPADPALGGTTTIDFTKGASDVFTVTGGTPSYQADGIHLSVAQPGDAPTLTSKWYMMFGKIEVKMKAAPGQGVVSSLVLQSDDLDEIDFEWIGGDDTKVQSNYFGKGLTLTYDRGAYHSNPNNHDWHTYSVEFTANQIVWQVDGQTVRAMTQSSAEANQYPQTPMQLKFGIWAGGAPGNSAGTIAWAGGPINYGGGPYTMIVQSITATDYSTGSSYSYGDTSGNWQSIRSAGGSINSGGAPDTPAPSITQVSSGDPTPFGGTHRDSSSFVTPSIWPWVPSSVAAGGVNQASQTNGPDGLPSSWSVSSSGNVVAPSSACATQSSSSSSSPPPSSASVASSAPVVVPPPVSSAPEPQPTTTQQPNPPPTTTTAAAQAGSITTLVYNAQGLPTTIVVPQGWTKQYDQQGFLIFPSGVAKRDVEKLTTRRRTNGASDSVTTITLSSTLSSASSLTTSVTTITSTYGQSVDDDSSTTTTSTSASSTMVTSTTATSAVSSTSVSSSAVSATSTPGAAPALRNVNLLGFGAGTVVSLLLSLSLGL